MIQVTGNYFKDLASAIESGLFVQNAKPKKVDLYAAIEVHNAQATESQTEDEPIEIVDTEPMIRYTTADEAYDGFGTKTIEVTGYQDKRKRPIRKIAINPVHFDWQSDRNGSGLHSTWTEQEFLALIDCGFLVAVSSKVELTSEPKIIRVNGDNPMIARLSEAGEVVYFGVHEQWYTDWQKGYVIRDRNNLEHYLERAIKSLQPEPVAEVEQPRVKVARDRKPSVPKAIKQSKKDPAAKIAWATEIAEKVATMGVAQAAQELDKSSTYIRRTVRALEIYQASESIRVRFERGDIGWSVLHKAAEKKNGIETIEMQIQQSLKVGAA